MRGTVKTEADAAPDAPAVDRGARARGRPLAADRAHVGLATIYRRWSTKQEFVIAAMSRAKAKVERPETDDARADLEALLLEMTNDIFGPKSCFVVGFITALRNDPELGRVFRE
jgi:AcrR family transcriptional regulator